MDLGADPTFAPFLEPGFNAAEFVSAALAGSITTAQALRERLAEEVQARQVELLQQAASLREAEHAVQGIALGVEALQASMRRVRGDLTEPYDAVQRKTGRLENLHSAVELLRAALQHAKLTQRLHVLLAQPPTGGALDLAKAAKLLSDITAVSDETDLSGLAAVSAEDAFLKAAGEQIRSQAQAALEKGLETLSQAEAVGGLVRASAEALERLLTASLDPRKVSAAGGGGGVFGPGGARSAGTPTLGSSSKEAVWTGLGAALEAQQRAAAAAWQLQRVLAKKRDPLSHVLFAEALADECPDMPPPLDLFWQLATAKLRTTMDTAANPAKGGIVRETLLANYPRLAALLEDHVKRLLADTNVKGVAPAASPEQQDALLDGARAFQNAYLAAALTRMSDAVSSAFLGGNRALPTAADLHKCIGRLHEELKAVGESARLAALTAHGIGKALRLLAERAEYMAAAGPEVRNVAGACSSAQLRNITLCSQLQEVAHSIASILPRMPPLAAAALTEPLEGLEAAAAEVVLPMVRAAVERSEQLLLRMHEADFGGNETRDVTGASPFIAEFVRFLGHSRVELLSKFSPAPSPTSPTVIGALTQRWAARLLVFYVRHASLLRPISDAGELQIAKDMAELEEGIGAHVWPLDQIGAPLRRARTFRRLLFVETPIIGASPLLAEIPGHVVLLFLFSRAPPALQSPHARSGFTPAQYSLWLDQHSEAEILKSIRSALEACAPEAAGQPGYEEVYPLMHALATKT